MAVVVVPAAAAVAVVVVAVGYLEQGQESVGQG